VRLNGALFFSKYDDQQTFAQQLDASGANWFRTMNAGKAEMLGAELELLAEPIDNLRIEGSFGYIDYELIDNQGNNLLFEGDNCNGERCYSQRTPKYTWALGLQYGFGMGQGGSITPRIDAVYQSKIYFTTNNQGPQDGYTRC
jgi:iron complex outermembrane receptor protein